jgi:2'-5' RNA ligase
MPIRTFIAVATSPDVRQAALKLIGRLRLSENAREVKWVAAENLHWTLQFLGNLDEREIPTVCDAVSTAVAELDPFELEARGAGAFPAADRPRTLWIGAGQGERAICVLHSAIERRLKKRGFRGEQRKFVPHITIGRAGRAAHPRSLSDDLSTLADYDAGTMLVDEVTVYASELKSDGPEYRVLSRAALGS